VVDRITPVLCYFSPTQSETAPSEDAYDNLEEKRVITGSEQTTAKKLGEIKESEITLIDHRGRFYETKGVYHKNNSIDILYMSLINLSH
jgi:hypothetical protein